MLPENAELAMADTDQAHLFIPYEGVHKEQLDRGSRGVRNTPPLHPTTLALLGPFASTPARHYGGTLTREPGTPTHRKSS